MNEENSMDYELSVEVIDSYNAFVTLEKEWNELIERSDTFSFYSTFTFTKIAWKHFSKKTDRLFILLIKRDGKVIGIAPFRISIERMFIIPIRVIRFVAEWGEGDRPKIVTAEDSMLIWEKIYHFLHNEFKQWDKLCLVEQDEDNPILNDYCFSNIYYYKEYETASISFSVSTKGTWEEYLEKYKPKKRTNNWKRHYKKFFGHPKGATVQCVTDNAKLPEALNRFIIMEQSGWKKNRPFSVGGNEKQRNFYHELVRILGFHGLVSIYLLKLGTQDAAGWIIYYCRDITYAAHTSFNPDLSKYATGILLLSEIIKENFSTYNTEVDLLGMHPKDGKQQYKEEWGTDTRETITISIWKIKPKIVLFCIGIIIKRLKKKLK